MELMKDDELSAFNLGVPQINDVTGCYDVPGYLYEELGEASSVHPCAGSACMMFHDPLGQLCSIDVIAYYDYNPKGIHANGKPHWNFEKRFMKDGQEIGRSKGFCGHVVADCAEITIESEFDGKLHSQTVRRDDSSP